MQPKLCTKCKKNIAVVFITKIENGNTLNEGYCLKCARSLGIPQIDAAVKQMGISEEDLDALSDEMGNVFGQTDIGEEEDPDSRTVPGWQSARAATQRAPGPGGRGGVDSQKEQKAQIPGQLLHGPHRPRQRRQTG